MESRVKNIKNDPTILNATKNEIFNWEIFRKWISGKFSKNRDQNSIDLGDMIKIYENKCWKGKKNEKIRRYYKENIN